MALLVVMSWQLVHLVARPVPGLGIAASRAAARVCAVLTVFLFPSRRADRPGVCSRYAKHAGWDEACTLFRAFVARHRGQARRDLDLIDRVL
jgi:hypothetical protein